MSARIPSLISRHAATLVANIYDLCNLCKASICCAYVTLARKQQKDLLPLYLWQKPHIKPKAKIQLWQPMSEEELFLQQFVFP